MAKKDDMLTYADLRGAGAFKKHTFHRKWVSFMERGKLYRWRSGSPNNKGPCMMFLGFENPRIKFLLANGSVGRFVWEVDVDPEHVLTKIELPL